jgi:ATP-dependent Lhr-like helicase
MLHKDVVSLARFHPAVRAWFEADLGAPTVPQREGWPFIFEGHSTLVAAPTGSGKTLAAFLSAIDGLVRESLAGSLADETVIASHGIERDTYRSGHWRKRG